MPIKTSEVDAPRRVPARNMVWIPGGEFHMGSEQFYPEERPVRRVAVDGFWMDDHPVTVAEFRRFKRFPTNGYGLYDMAGNVWEWTADPFTPDHSEPFHLCCAPEHGRGLRLLVNSTPMPRSSYTYFSRTPPGSAL